MLMNCVCVRGAELPDSLIRNTSTYHTVAEDEVSGNRLADSTAHDQARPV